MVEQNFSSHGNKREEEEETRVPTIPFEGMPSVTKDLPLSLTP
jgi:hypothetical protein